MAVKSIGIIGGGQLATLMAEVAPRIPVKIRVQTPSLSDPIARCLPADALVLAALEDMGATAHLARHCDVITFENEFVNLDALATLADRGVCFRPSLESLRPLLDKYDQRCYLQACGIPVPPFVALQDPQDVDIASWSDCTPIAFPAVLKARRHGYDGKGTAIVRDRPDLKTTWETWHHCPALLEAFVPFERELAVVGARSIAGEIALFPIVETQQEHQVCRRVFAPADISATAQRAAETIGRQVLTSLDAVGVFAVELFCLPGDRVLANEIAPRVHNSGHLTLEACATSQFEQHLRAIGGFPLGSSALQYPAAAMVNLLGLEVGNLDYAPQRQQLAEQPSTIVHWYGKPRSLPGRKLGHATTYLLPGEPPASLMQRVQTLETLWYR